MSGLSPASVLFSSDGYEVAVVQNVTIPAGTRAIISAGSDGTNARPVLVDSSGRPVVVGAGTAGTAVGGVLTVQGIASGTAITISGTVTANIGTTNGLALDATLAKLTIAQGTALGANTQALIGGSVTTAAPTYTTGQISPLSLTTAGAVRIDGSGTTQPVSGTVTANIGTTNGLALDATLSAQSLVDNAAFTDGTSRVVPSGFIFDETAGTALTENDVGAGRMDSKRAIVHVLEDGYTRGVRAIIKPASTAPVATDPALVVAISPNSSLPVITDRSATGTVTSVAASVTNVTLLASNVNRVLATIFNESNAKLFVKLAATASATSYTVSIFPNSYWELPLSYTGIIDGIWAAGATGSARVTELT